MRRTSGAGAAIPLPSESNSDGTSHVNNAFNLLSPIQMVPHVNNGAFNFAFSWAWTTSIDIIVYIHKDLRDGTEQPACAHVRLLGVR